MDADSQRMCRRFLRSQSFRRRGRCRQSCASGIVVDQHLSRAGQAEVLGTTLPTVLAAPSKQNWTGLARWSNRLHHG